MKFNYQSLFYDKIPFYLTFLIPVFIDWIQFKYIYHVPLAILAAGIELLAALALGIGLILDASARHDKIRAELLLMKKLSN